MNTDKHRYWIQCLCLIAFVLLLCIACDHKGHSISSMYDDGALSVDLDQDIKLMWETQGFDVKFDSPSITQRHASTNHAINAASRVFNTVKLIGKTQQQVIDLLGDPQKSSNSIYNFPFWPAPENALVYRFDNGQCGWQFNILMDQQNQVVKLERLWIQ